MINDEDWHALTLHSLHSEPTSFNPQFSWLMSGLHCCSVCYISGQPQSIYAFMLIVINPIGISRLVQFTTEHNFNNSQNFHNRSCVTTSTTEVVTVVTCTSHNFLSQLSPQDPNFYHRAREHAAHITVQGAVFRQAQPYAHRPIIPQSKSSICRLLSNPGNSANIHPGAWALR